MRTGRKRGSRGFTFIEVIVVMAIIAILAGIMVPFAYKMWESNEIDDTKQRMLELKKAMVGDKTMIQNGIRTNFGFVGECGQLPQTLDALVNPSGMLYQQRCKDNAPYMPAGFDPSKYGKDAWGNDFVWSVTAPDPATGRIGTLRSSGPDRTAGTSDDINETTDPDLQIYEQEVTPTNRLSGGASVTLTNSSTASINANRFYLGVTATYVSAFSPAATVTPLCIQLPPMTVDVGQVQTVTVNIDNATLSAALPVGKALFRCALHNNDSSCGAGSVVVSPGDMGVFIADNINSIYATCPSMSYVVTGP
ncbi:MAG: type II secretion system protein [Nitrospiraceae bacterium]|nr:type II secretion system protein [Nitrospiraceae bacterium]